MIKQYRKKPVVISAIQFTGWNWKACLQFMSDEILVFEEGMTKREKLEIETLEGTMRVSIDDYIIRGVNGEYYPCKPDIFDKTYEAIE